MAVLEKDTGWAWVVLAASTASLFIFVVLSASVGFFQVEIMEDLGVGAGPISIMSALALGQSCVVGPLSGVMSSLLSVRVTVYLGVSLYAGGLVLASFSQSLASLTFFFGFLTGFGFGIAYTASVIVINLHFERHRLLASGVIMCASGLGILSIPHAISWALAEHGWRWTCTMVGAFVLHVAILATVYFPTDTERLTMIRFDRCWEKLKSRWRGGESKRRNLEKVCAQEEGWEECVDGLVVNEDHEEEHGVNRTIGQHKANALDAEDDGHTEKDIAEQKSMEFHENDCSRPEEMCLMRRDNASKLANALKGSPIKATCDEGVESEISQVVTHQKSTKDVATLSNVSINFPEFISGEDKKSFNLADHILKLEREQTFQGSLKSLPLTFRARNGVIECLSSPRLSPNTKISLDLKPNTRDATPSNTRIHTNSEYSAAFLNASVEHVHYHKSPVSIPRKRSSSSVSHQSYRSLRAPTHLSQSQASPRLRGSDLLWKSRSWIHSQTDIVGSSPLLPVKVEEIKTEASSENERSVKENIHIVIHCKFVWMLCLTSFCFIFGFGMTTVHFPSFAERQGVARESISQFYTAQGLVVMVARLSGGFLLNGFRSKPPLVPLLIVLQTLMGLVLALAPFYATGVAGLHVMQIGIAVTYGVGYMLFAPICVQILGVDLLAISFGLVQLFIGTGYILSPIIAGYLYDATGTFDVPMILGGSVITVGVLPLAVTTCFSSCKASSVANSNDVEVPVEAPEGEHMLEQDKAKA